MNWDIYLITEAEILCKTTWGRLKTGNQQRNDHVCIHKAMVVLHFLFESSKASRSNESCCIHIEFQACQHVVYLLFLVRDWWLLFTMFFFHRSVSNDQHLETIIMFRPEFITFTLSMIFKSTFTQAFPEKRIIHLSLYSLAVSNLTGYNAVLQL